MSLFFFAKISSDTPNTHPNVSSSTPFSGEFPDNTSVFFDQQ
jgi:hypothetical protein